MNIIHSLGHRWKIRRENDNCKLPERKEKRAETFSLLNLLVVLGCSRGRMAHQRPTTLALIRTSSSTSFFFCTGWSRALLLLDRTTRTFCWLWNKHVALDLSCSGLFPFLLLLSFVFFSFHVVPHSNNYNE